MKAWLVEEPTDKGTLTYIYFPDEQDTESVGMSYPKLDGGLFSHRPVSDLWIRKIINLPFSWFPELFACYKRGHNGNCRCDIVRVRIIKVVDSTPLRQPQTAGGETTSRCCK